MNKSSSQSGRKVEKSTLLSDLKSLFKGIVLIANVLPVFAGFWLALHFTNASFYDYWDQFLLAMIGSTFVIAGALLFNNWYEVDLDREMSRTQTRPTVTGNISLKTVFIMANFFSLIGMIILLFTTMEAVFYAWIGWFSYVVLYTFWSKRKYTLNTILGSLSGAVTPLIGWAVVDSAIHIVPITLFAILFIWQIPHTFSIAIKRYKEYKAAGVPMLPVVYGFDVTKRQIIVYIACLFPLPLFLISLGIPFIIVATLLNIAWLILAVRGFYTKDDWKWAHRIFISSLIYLSVLFIMMVIVTLPPFS
ncbi:MAG TPA: heme o synthase [Bacillota bacterium]|nr:heme o synthase [Bacillota bacterium]